MRLKGADFVKSAPGPRRSAKAADEVPWDWEQLWAPYDEASYAPALEYVPAGAAVLDIGAGDLRFARRLAERARIVYAIERQAVLLPDESALPPNLIVFCGDARTLPFPVGIDTAVLLMRHCAHFGLYREKLEAVGCRRLITNARWRMGVECIDLTLAPRLYDELALGWYACRCGATGFRPGPSEALNEQLAETIHEVERCPECQT
jgi:hypothetical protein